MRVGILFFFALALAGHERPGAAGTTVTLATIHWPPYVVGDGDSKGFFSEILTEAFHRTGHPLSIRYLPWARGLREVEAGAVDGIYPAYRSEAREKKFLISSPIVSSPLVLCARKGAGIRYGNLRDLAPYRIGVVRGYANTPEFDAADYLTLDRATTDEQNLKKLLRGRVDLVVIDRYVARHLLRALGKEGEAEFLEPPLDKKSLHVMFSRSVEGVQALVRDLDDGLEAMRRDGTLEAILSGAGR